MGDVEKKMVDVLVKSQTVKQIPLGFEECEASDVVGSFKDIYVGEFSLLKDSIVIRVKGRIFTRWGLNSHLKLSADIISVSDGADLIGYIIEEISLTVLLNGDNFGQVELRELNENKIEGVFCDLSPESDLDVTSVSFSLLNTKNIANRCVQPFGKNGVDWSMCELDNEEYLVRIQHHSKINEIRSFLRNDAGFAITHYGELLKKEGIMTRQESEDVIKCLNFFLTFVNGRKTGLVDIFKHKVNGPVWRDPLGSQNDIYKTVRSWFPLPIKVREDFLNDLWKDFYRTWFIEDESENLRQLIQLYVESNLNLIYIENCLILSQTALEIYYDWKIPAKVHKDAPSRIKAILLDSLKITSDIPFVLNELLEIKNVSFQNSKLDDYRKSDGPDCIVEIRNSIVHPERWRKDNLKKITTGMRVDTWLLANWYVELCILKAISYNGMYKNRLKVNPESIEKVPWSIALDES